MPKSVPNITINALVRYSLAKAPERQRIVREFRDNPFPPFKGWYGGEVEGAVRRYIALGGIDDEPLSSLESILEKRPCSSEHEDNKILKQLEALEATRHTNLTALSKAAKVTMLKDSVLPMHIEGVRVSVRPTNMATATQLGIKELKVGVVKPYFACSASLSPDAAKMYGVLLHWYAETQLSHIGVADSALCSVIDVFNQQIHQAPKAYKQRRDIIAASCIEFAALWSSLPPAVSMKARAVS